MLKWIARLEGFLLCTTPPAVGTFAFDVLPSSTVLELAYLPGPTATSWAYTCLE